MANYFDFSQLGSQTDYLDAMIGSLFIKIFPGITHCLISTSDANPSYFKEKIFNSKNTVNNADDLQGPLSLSPVLSSRYGLGCSLIHYANIVSIDARTDYDSIDRADKSLTLNGAFSGFKIKADKGGLYNLSGLGYIVDADKGCPLRMVFLAESIIRKIKIIQYEGAEYVDVDSLDSYSHYLLDVIHCKTEAPSPVFVDTCVSYANILRKERERGADRPELPGVLMAG